MTLPTMSAAATTSRALEKFNIPQRTFALLVGISVGQLNEYLSGKKPLPGALAERFQDTVRLIRQLTAIAGGLPLDWSPSNGKHFKLVLDALDKGQFRISIEDLTDGSKIMESAAFLAGGLAALSGKAEPEKTEEHNVADNAA